MAYGNTSNIPSTMQSTPSGVTATAGELNDLDNVVDGTVLASKAVVVDASKDIGTFGDVALTTLTYAATLITATAAELNKLDQSVADVYADGFLQPRVAQATWDFAVDGGAISAIGLGVTIPANSIIVGGVLDMQTTATSTDTGTDKATGAISVEGANDIVSAVAIETGTPWDQGLQVIIPKFTAGTMVKVTSAAAITFTIAVAAMLTGKFTVHLFYIPTLVDV